jgi:hypothetical protein
LLFAAETPSQTAAASPVSTWKVGTPIVTYWGAPPLNDSVAQQLADGGYNLIWCKTEKELDLAQRHGLRAQFVDSLISPQSLDAPVQRKKLDALIDSIRRHPALYSYFVVDEPNVAVFPAFSRIVAYLRQHDPAHLAYINLLPTNAPVSQLGTQGDATTAYREYLSRYLDVVKPALLSYDHYQLGRRGDEPRYFLSLALVRQAALRAGLPFLNIVQSCSCTPSTRIPNGDEMRFLAYTTLAYGAQGISYFVYYSRSSEVRGGILLPDGTRTPLYDTLKTVNREFTAVAAEVQPLRSLGAYHVGMQPPGTELLPKDSPFRLEPAVPLTKYQVWKPVKGMLLGCFGAPGKASAPSMPTHVLVVNLDYKAAATTALVGPRNVEVFDATNRTWSPANGCRAALSLPPGGGTLVRLPGGAGQE